MQCTTNGRNYSGFPFARKSAAIIRIFPLTVRILCNRQNSSVRHSQYAQIQSLWTGSEVCNFVKSSEIVNIFPLAVDILWNFWYCDGVRKVYAFVCHEIRGGTSGGPAYLIYTETSISVA